MKRIIMTVFALAFIASLSILQVSAKELKYTEIPAYKFSGDYYYTLSKKTVYKVPNQSIYGFKDKEKEVIKGTWFNLNGSEKEVCAQADFFEKNPDIIERLDTIKQIERLEKKDPYLVTGVIENVTMYVQRIKSEKEPGAILYALLDIEGIPPLEELIAKKENLEKAKAEAERAAQEAENAKNEKIFEQFKVVDTELKSKSPKYTYHGISENETTEKLLKARALSANNAYVSKLNLSEDLNYIQFTEFVGYGYGLGNWSEIVTDIISVKYSDAALRGQIALLEAKSGDDVWYCYTPNSAGGVTIIGFGVSKNTYGSSKYKLYSEWLSKKQ